MTKMHYRKTGQNRPLNMVGYEAYWSVIRLKPIANYGRLKPGRLCKLVVFNTYNRPQWWSVMCFCILRNMVPHYDTCHHVETGVTPRQNQTVKPTTVCGRLCPFYSLLTGCKTDHGQTFTHGRLCAVGYDTVGLSLVWYPDLYNRPTHNRPSLKKTVSFLELCITYVVGFI